ncbi:DUF3604 domain-containing protein [Candidatus Halobonum tyrrellensis]|uniref:DUF3604 domain-containing protein n=1 Tax=Candidatus Halobonum tyrrellensis G22 TaxID=1324957 RepID=V4HGF2_9EURY|nr:DUF3604 domain-containing protein [Candidatus Halobonum tyrrellensis]ESP86874.1 hypothetical protein K933_16472 [Candidatus Halobonum tyrrellensis G22]
MTLGPAILSDGRESVASFLRGAPSVRQLLASRHSAFESAHLILPSTAVVGESVTLSVQAWDRYERLVPDPEAAFAVETTDPAATLPTALAFDGSPVVRLDGVRFETPGVHYVAVEHRETGERFVSNPVEVHATPPDSRVYWGDLHFHSRLSDGVGGVATGFEFAREVMGLDVVACTDHDTMGFFIPPSLQRRRMHRRYFDRTKRLVDDHHDPGEFVTLFGYEWTKQPNAGGHINVYYESPDAARLFDSRSPESDTYEKLWARLREWRDETGERVLTIPHHPAEALYPFDFDATDYDDELAPLVEVYSQWGSSELRGADGNPKPIGGIGNGEVDVPGHYVQDALAMGHRVGMLASSDIHGPYPGHSHIHVDPHLPRASEWLRDGVGWGLIWRVWNERSYPGGLTAFRASDLSRESVFDALEGRAVYGTTQPRRILVSLSVDGHRLRDEGSAVAVGGPDAERRVECSVAGTAPLDRVEVVKNNAVWRVAEPDDSASDDGAASGEPAAANGYERRGDAFAAYTLTASFVDDEPLSGIRWDERRGTDDDHYYLRVRQVDGGMAWAGPIWASADGTDDAGAGGGE